jgi:TonB family protein
MNRSGIVLDARILKSSGIGDLDRAALITIRSASPIPYRPNISAVTGYTSPCQLSTDLLAT